ncbi:hypothetical protein POVWA2_015720 [Plasmodium ovale wallikeri]|uniref:Uncharacterized protein n=1 Tax=Plasmodium ovale wallikeri TaxID=864142 RepID=A0A1A8YNT2_PLAOA|nr:hypothetical protein POVWA1_016220 [Plasmodium ovale wallikeri]SBT33620.1 hypothetical protein POVWA2_015720 [Plasmodium ovale wallikeri]
MEPFLKSDKKRKLVNTAMRPVKGERDQKKNEKRGILSESISKNQTGNYSQGSKEQYTYVEWADFTPYLSC